MLGVYAVLNKYSNKKLLESKIIFDKSHNLKTVTNLNSTFSLVYPNKSRDYAYFSNKTGFILIDGFVFDNNGKRIYAKELFELITNELDIIKNFNGEFFIVYNHKDETYCFNDIFGQRQHYISNLKSEISIAPSPGVSLDILDLKKNLNKKSFLTFILTNKIRYQDQSIWNNSKIYPPASILIHKKDNFKFDKYWTLTHANTIQKFDSELFIELYKKAVNQRVLSNNIGITLTGGLDSRSMIAAIKKSKLNNISAYTIGSNSSDEVTIAKKVANNLKLNHNVFKIDPDLYFSNEYLKYFENEDIDLIIQGVWKPFSKEINNHDYILHGLDLDVTLGGIYLTKELSKINKKQDFIDYVLKNNLRIDNKNINALFKKPIIDFFDINEYLTDLANDFEGKNFLEKYDKFIMQNSMNRVILQRYRGIRRHVETISPMYDRKLLDYIFSLNINERVNYKSFYPFINQLTPDLCKINYQRTGLPANIPVKYWKKNQLIQTQTEELYRKIARDSNGNKLIPYNKYYTNADEWMRFNKIWVNYLFEMLQSKNSIIRKDWINGKYVDKLINEHINHKKSNFGILLTLISAEYFLRTT